MNPVIAGILMVAIGVGAVGLFMKATGRENGFERQDRLSASCRDRGGVYLPRDEICLARNAVIGDWRARSATQD
jgi:hypothetical protein